MNPYKTPGLGELAEFICLRCEHRDEPGKFDCQPASIGCPECKDVKVLAGVGTGYIEKNKKRIPVTLAWTEYHAHRNAMARRLGINPRSFPVVELRVSR